MMDFCWTCVSAAAVAPALMVSLAVAVAAVADGPMTVLVAVSTDDVAVSVAFLVVIERRTPTWPLPYHELFYS